MAHIDAGKVGLALSCRTAACAATGQFSVTTKLSLLFRCTATALLDGIHTAVEHNCGVYGFWAVCIWRAAMCRWLPCNWRLVLHV